MNVQKRYYNQVDKGRTIARELSKITTSSLCTLTDTKWMYRVLITNPNSYLISTRHGFAFSVARDRCVNPFTMYQRLLKRFKRQLVSVPSIELWASSIEHTYCPCNRSHVHVHGLIASDRRLSLTECYQLEDSINNSTRMTVTSHVRPLWNCGVSSSDQAILTGKHDSHDRVSRGTLTRWTCYLWKQSKMPVMKHVSQARRFAQLDRDTRRKYIEATINSTRGKRLKYTIIGRYKRQIKRMRTFERYCAWIIEHATVATFHVSRCGFKIHHVYHHEHVVMPNVPVLTYFMRFDTS